jgi:acetyl esterase/lipase
VRGIHDISDGWRLIVSPIAGTMADMDPELKPFVSMFPADDLADPVAAREVYAKLAAGVPVPDTAGLEIEDRTVRADPDVAVRIYRPRSARSAIVWLHGGGFVMGNLDTEHLAAVPIAKGSGAVVISVGYRLAPEHRYPAALDDAYAALTWTAENAPALGIDPGRIAIGGLSNGAGMAAAVALRARDQQGPPIRFQLLFQGAFDDRLETWSVRNFIDTPFVYRAKVAAMWRHYLNSAPAPPYAAPARAADLSGLPSAYIATGELDPLRDEGISYAQRLLRAGVSVELHQWAGTFHGSQGVLSAGVSQRQIAELTGALRRGLDGEAVATAPSGDPAPAEPAR